MIKTLKIFVLICLTLAIFNKQANASLLYRELTLMSEKFTKTIKETWMITPVNIGILPFNSSDTNIQQRQIGVGVAELLIGAFLKQKSGVVAIIERGQINKILEEQKLILSGLMTESETAKLGELLSAKALVTGEVSKEGENYIVTSRLIDTTTGKILSSYNTKFAIDDFEQKAKKYIIPRRESTAFYLGYQFINLTSVGSVSATKGNLTVSDPIPIHNNQQFFVFGGRAFLMENIMFDFSFGFNFTTLQSTKDFSLNINGVRNDEQNFGGGSFKWAISGFWVQPLNPFFDIFAGIGVDSYNFEDIQLSAIFTAINGGIEYRPVSWIGIGFFVKYALNVSSSSGKIEVWDSSASKFQNISLPLFKFDSFSFFPTLSFYF